jgi:DNA-damage-inducible protein D
MTQSPFEAIKRQDEDGREYWLSRELGEILGYAKYANFTPAIEKAKIACENSGQAVADHFPEFRNMVDIGSGAKREIESLALSRYACYLIVQNADPTKLMVAMGQTYFALQTHRQELADQAQLTEEQRRVMLRQEMKTHQKKLFAAAKDAGVADPKDFAIFQNYGYKGLYGGMGKSEIKKYKRLGDKQEILDHAGSTELAANLFRATQTEEKLKRDGIKDKILANATHLTVGQKVRKTMLEISGVAPEDLPVEEDIKKVERRLTKELGDGKAN